MRSPFFFIAKPLEGKRYNNTKEVSGIELITSTSEENHLASNRMAVVESTPIGYNGPIQKGDTLLVHHNVFKFYNDMKGRKKSGKSFFKNDLFFIENDQFYMYKHNDHWSCHDRYCFVEPIPKEDSFLYKNFRNEPLIGIMKYSNEYLKSKGINSGDKICFKPESEYQFEVDGKKLYRMFDHQITLKL